MIYVFKKKNKTLMLFSDLVSVRLSFHFEHMDLPPRPRFCCNLFLPPPHPQFSSLLFFFFPECSFLNVLVIPTSVVLSPSYSM